MAFASSRQGGLNDICTIASDHAAIIQAAGRSANVISTSSGASKQPHSTGKDHWKPRRSRVVSAASGVPYSRSGRRKFARLVLRLPLVKGVARTSGKADKMSWRLQSNGEKIPVLSKFGVNECVDATWPRVNCLREHFTDAGISVGFEICAALLPLSCLTTP